jgi:hypothetical protein
MIGARSQSLASDESFVRSFGPPGEADQIKKNPDPVLY